MRILVAEADASFADSLCQRLSAEQFEVCLATSGESARRLSGVERYNLVVLDLDPPHVFGLDLLQYIKTKIPDVPVFVFTGPSDVAQRVQALDAGADDHLVKPFAFAELAARIRAVLRRYNRPPESVLTIEDLSLDRLSHAVERRGRAVDLSRREFALLEFLMRHAGRPVTRAAIFESVWKASLNATTNVVDVYINYLRRKVDTGFDHALIHTIRGVGYQIGGNGTQGQQAS